MKLEAVFEQTHKLPTIPKVVQELIDSFNQDDIDIAVVAKKIAMDQVITAKVLRLANSAHYGAARQIGSVDDAVIVLGFNTLRTLVVASGVTGAFVATPGFDRKKFWKHSLDVASIAKALSKQAKINAETAFTCGLIHNIGELLIHIVAPNEAVIIDKAVAVGANRVNMEDNQIGFDYVMVGEELARRWNFPLEIQQAIKYQVKPMEQEPASKLTGVLHVSAILADAIEENWAADDIRANLPSAVVSQLGLDVEKIIEDLPNLSSQASSLAEQLLAA